MKKIPLTQGKFAIVDDEDYDFLMQWKWWYKNDIGRNTGYAVRTKSFPRKNGVHGDGLNNTRRNLRLCTNQQNKFNTYRKKSGDTSIYRGVYINKMGRISASIFAKGKKISLGVFDKEIDVALAYNIAALKYFGEFARLNDV